VTHDQTEALTMSDRVAILRDGSLEQVDEGRAIYEHPASIFVAQFLGETNLIVGTVESIDNRLASVQTSYGKLVGVVSGDIHENAKVTLCVRPESLVIGDEAKHLTNRIVGKVIQKVFRGTTNKIIVALSTGEVMRLVNLSYSDVHVDLGDDCEIGWEPEHCTILQH
jgi:ABC-type Fe3+/spermidine/putrescine transport system ATPase subunit